MCDSIKRITQVHHIDPHGRDSGVVYSEMQGRENTAGDRMALVSVDFYISCMSRSSKG
jgi:Zn-dependent M16 (insulinase) family peptidase